jgi:hypothetical protein
VVPSVSKIIETIGFIDWGMIDSDTLLSAQQRGTYVHTMTTMIDADTLDVDELDPALKPYADGYNLFRRQCQPKVLVSERIVYSARHQYAGRLDRIFIIGGKAALVDVKSGVCDDVVGVQLAGYEIAYGETFGDEACKIKAKYGLQLLPTGQYNLVAYDNPNYSKVFLSALTVQKYKQRRKASERKW